MMAFLKDKLSQGPFEARIMAVGGNMQVSLKVQICEVDDIGMLCRVKGMMSGWGELEVRPWACITNVSFN